MAVRIALQSSDDDARLVFADDNPAARLLSRPGEAIYNASNGLVEGNSPFQCAWLDRSVQEELLVAIHERADQSGLRRETPLVVFEGNAPAELEHNQPLANMLAAPSSGQVRAPEAWLGEPVAIRPPLAVRFNRQSGNILLLVGRNTELASGMLSALIVSLATQCRSDVTSDLRPIQLLHFGASEGDEIDPLADLSERLPRSVSFGRRRQLDTVFDRLGRELDARTADDGSVSSQRPSVFLVIHGLHAARDLFPEDGMGYSFGTIDAVPAAPTPAQRFTELLRNGPEVGIHTIMWCNTMAGAERALNRTSLREIALRVALQMSAEDSTNFVNGPVANRLGENRALLFNEDEGLIQKFRPYGLPSPGWLELASAYVNR